jgi:hypothetical protein
VAESTNSPSLTGVPARPAGGGGTDATAGGAVCGAGAAPGGPDGTGVPGAGSAGVVAGAGAGGAAPTLGGGETTGAATGTLATADGVAWSVVEYPARFMH